MLSRKAKYGMMACLNLAKYYDRGSRLIQEIATEENIPKKFLELILLDLKNAGLLESKKGKGGGYALAKRPEDITIGTIARIIDGPLAPLRCASVTAPVMCDDCPHPEYCGIRMVMKDARDAISDVLDHTSLAEVARRSEEERSRQKPEPMFYI